MKLFYKQIGNSNPPLIIIHGLYGSSDNWLSVARLLQNNFTIYLIDQRNHGLSPHSPQMNYASMANDLKEFMLDNNILHATILGHSMGGKTAMAFALLYPNFVDRLIIVDVAPKLYSNKNIAQSHKKIIEALLSINLAEHKSRSSINKALSKYIKNDALRGFLLKNIGSNKDKTLYWKLNINTLNKSLHELMDGTALFDSAEPFPKNKNVLFIKGEKSPYIIEDDLPNIFKYFPSATITEIHDAGHWLHAEQTELFIDSVINLR